MRYEKVNKKALRKVKYKGPQINEKRVLELVCCGRESCLVFRPKTNVTQNMEEHDVKDQDTRANSQPHE